MKKIIIFFGILFCGFAHSAQIVNVEYIHNAIANRWDITIPYNPALTNPRVAANMKYLLSAIDVANEMLNGEPTTYGTGEYATSVAADTVATDTAVDELVKKTEKYVFTMRYSSFEEGLNLYAAGTFYIDWGDGVEQVIEKPNVGQEKIFHPNGYTGAMTIRLGGRATAYDTNPVIGNSCAEIDQVTMIDGCLGCIFPTLPNGDQPSFARLFHFCDFETIPSGLFNGVYGPPTEKMFYYTFASNPDLKSIPENLFAGISGPPAESMFEGTFSASFSLTSIPENLFGDISGDAASNMFARMFHFCEFLTGPSARINGRYLYEIWPDATSEQVGGMYFGATALSDYANIPGAWK